MLGDDNYRDDDDDGDPHEGDDGYDDEEDGDG